MARWVAIQDGGVGLYAYRLIHLGRGGHVHLLLYADMWHVGY
jgi:hypothetical protein